MLLILENYLPIKRKSNTLWDINSEQKNIFPPQNEENYENYLTSVFCHDEYTSFNFKFSKSGTS